eukprot:PhF_6_TR37555/c2_g1_i2/m.55633
MSLLSRIPDHLVHNILTPYLDAVSLIRLSSTNHAARELYRDDVDAIRTFFLTTPCANVRAARVMGFPCWRTFVKGITALCPHRMVMIEGWYPFDDFVFLDNGAGTFPFPPCASKSPEGYNHYLHPFHPFQAMTPTEQISLYILRAMFPPLPQDTALCESDIASFLKVYVTIGITGGDSDAAGVMSVVRTDGRVVSTIIFFDELYNRMNRTHLLSVDEFQRVYPKWTQWLRQGPVGPFPSALVNVFPDVKWIANDNSRIDGTRDDSDVFDYLSTEDYPTTITSNSIDFTELTFVLNNFHFESPSWLGFGAGKQICDRFK